MVSLRHQMCRLGRETNQINWGIGRVYIVMYDYYGTQTTTTCRTSMWAYAQRDGRPAEHRDALCSTPQFGWRPLLDCRAVTLPRRDTRWNMMGCPTLANRSQPLVGRSSPYREDIWRRYCCLTVFIWFVDTCLNCEDIAWQSCTMVPRWRFLATFLGPAFSASRAHSDLHSKFLLGPHHVSKYGRHPMCGRWD